MEEPRPLLRVRGLAKTFKSGGALARKQVHAVRGVDFDVPAGQTLGLVGESGSGKSTIARLVARLIEPSAGSVEFDGREITHLKGKSLRRVRRDIQMIFQDPLRSLDPRMTVRAIVEQPFRIHGIGQDRERRHWAVELLDSVGLSSSALERYPHEFSGGQRQRIAIARALALKPQLIIADEPTSSLDVSVQAQVLNLMLDLQDELGITLVFISHDLNVVRFVSDQIAVVYLGSIVEVGAATEVFARPRHPYTVSLMSANPSISRRDQELVALKGEIPSPTRVEPGCAFASRCPEVMDVCRTVAPPRVTDDMGRIVACHLFADAGDEQASDRLDASSQRGDELKFPRS